MKSNRAFLQLGAYKIGGLPLAVGVCWGLIHQSERRTSTETKLQKRSNSNLWRDIRDTLTSGWAIWYYVLERKNKNDSSWNKVVHGGEAREKKVKQFSAGSGGIGFRVTAWPGRKPTYTPTAQPTSTTFEHWCDPLELLDLRHNYQALRTTYQAIQWSTSIRCGKLPDLYKSRRKSGYPNLLLSIGAASVI